MSKKSPRCETCRFRRMAENKPKSFWAKLWRWHTKWCPGWKAYQRHMAEKQGEP